MSGEQLEPYRQQLAAIHPAKETWNEVRRWFESIRALIEKEFPRFATNLDQLSRGPSWVMAPTVGHKGNAEERQRAAELNNQLAVDTFKELVTVFNSLVAHVEESSPKRAGAWKRAPRDREELQLFMTDFLARYNDLRKSHGQSQVGADLFTVEDFGVWGAILWETTSGQVSIQGVVKDYDNLKLNLDKRARDVDARALLVRTFTIHAKGLNQNPSPELLAGEKWTEEAPKAPANDEAALLQNMPFRPYKRFVSRSMKPEEYHAYLQTAVLTGQAEERELTAVGGRAAVLESIRRHLPSFNPAGAQAPCGPAWLKLKPILVHAGIHPVDETTTLTDIKAFLDAVPDSRLAPTREGGAAYMPETWTKAPSSFDELRSFMAAFLARFNSLRKRHGQIEVGADVYSVSDCGVWAAILWETTPGQVNFNGISNFGQLESYFGQRAQELNARAELLLGFRAHAKYLNDHPSPETFAESKWAEAQASSGAAGEAENVNKADVFVIHGRNSAARDAVFDFLRALGLNPIEWEEAVRLTGKAAPFIGEILDGAFSNAQAVVAVLTGDDSASLREQFQQSHDPDYEKNPTPQARQNVLFEAGMAFGRHPERTIMLQIGFVRPFSDVAGRHIVRFAGTPEQRTTLRDRLKTAGCSVKEAGTDWLRAGDLKEALRLAGLAISATTKI